MKKSKEEPAEAVTVENRGAKRSRSLFSYYLPTLIVATIAIAVFTFTSSWLANEAASQRQERLAASLAKSVQKQVAELVQGKIDQLSMLAADPGFIKLARQEGKLQKLREMLSRKLPGSTLITVVSTRWEDEKVLQAVSGSYAAADMFQQVHRDRKVAPAQVVTDKSGRKHILLAVPMRVPDGIVAVLFAGYPMELLKPGLEELGLSESAVVLEQVVGRDTLLLAGSGNLPRKVFHGHLQVPGTIWQVRYAPPPVSGLSLPVLLGLVAGGAMLMLVVTLLGYRRLAHDYKSDLGLVVELVDATLKRKGSATPTPHLEESKPAIELLARYAQATFAAGKAAKAAENRAGMVQMVVDESETTAQPPEEVAALSEEQLPASMFRASVIRGLSDMDLKEETAQAIGLAFGSAVQESGGRQVAVARDNRATSDAYSASLVAGLLASGCDVLDLGEVPSPLLNYAMCNSAATSGVMVTGGHNPPEYNGFKIYLNSRPLGEQDYLELRQRILDGRFTKGMGKIESRDFSHDYIRHLQGDLQLVEPLKLVLDCGNGVTGPVAQRLFEALGCEVIPLFCEPDGGFPNHLADPSDQSNLQALMLEVQAQGAHLGIALDVDGDALALVDEQGRAVHADQLLMLLASDIIRRSPGADVVYDVACSAMLPEQILASGGRPIMWRTGHTEIQAKMKENGALLGGELSGHIYFNDRWYGFDDGMYTAGRLLEIFSMDPGAVSALFESYSGFLATPLLTMEVPEGKADQVVGKLLRSADIGDADVVDLDGLRLEYEHAWGLVRASNTRSALVFRFEARDEEALADIQERFRRYLNLAAPELQPPF